MRIKAGLFYAGRLTASSTKQNIVVFVTAFRANCSAQCFLVAHRTNRVSRCLIKARTIQHS